MSHHACLLRPSRLVVITLLLGLFVGVPLVQVVQVGRGADALASPQTPTGVAPDAPSQLGGWTMAGHDPERTGRSPVLGPAHPRLLWRRPHFSLDLVGPDGLIYGDDLSGALVLDPEGRPRMAYHPPLPAIALMPNGTLLAAGADDGAIYAFGQDGKLLWSDDHVGLFKSAVPLVTPGDLLYAPFEGHPEQGTAGLDILSSTGEVIRRIEPGVATFAVALSGGGRIYTIVQSVPSHQNSLRAYSPDGRVLWVHNLGPLPFEPGGCNNCPVVSADGIVYVATGQSVVAYRSSGRLAWRYRAGGAALALALRSDGILLVGSARRLNAVTPAGRKEWGLRLANPKGSDEAVTVVVDEVGKAYVGTSDGRVRVVSTGGRILATLHTGPRVSWSPRLALSPVGRLVVTGTDGELRVYG